jgi:methyl halide transferase
MNPSKTLPEVPHLTPQYWDTRYQKVATQWDLGEVSPPLKAYIDQLTDKGISILIPGCGNAYEAEYLSAQGFSSVTLIDISLVLANQLRARAGHLPGIEIHCHDFFDHKNTYDLILEQTFFCALHPSLRHRYVAHTRKLLKPGGSLVGVLFNRFFSGMEPPFGGSAEEYEALFKPHFHFHTFEPCYNSARPRAGNELFINLQAPSGSP